MMNDWEKLGSKRRATQDERSNQYKDKTEAGVKKKDLNDSSNEERTISKLEKWICIYNNKMDG